MRAIGTLASDNHLETVYLSSPASSHQVINRDSVATFRMCLGARSLSASFHILMTEILMRLRVDTILFSYTVLSLHVSQRIDISDQTRPDARVTSSINVGASSRNT